MAVVAVLWLNGAFDEMLANAGLNTQTCAQNLFGAKLCGDDLVAFCKSNYDPDINAATCDDVLRDEGIDPTAIAAGEKKKKESDDAEFDDDSIQHDVRNMVSEVEACAIDTRDYALCQNDEQLDYPIVSIGDGPGDVEVQNASGSTFDVVGHSESGTDFTISRDETGAATRSCSKPGFGSCPASGTW